MELLALFIGIILAFGAVIFYAGCRYERTRNKQFNLILKRIAKNQEVIMATAQDILDNATQETTLIGSIQALITSLLEGEIVTPTMQAKLDAIFGTQEANEATLNAIKANLETPPAPPEP